ncbi:MAG: ornithine carbamoyltransferase, partial [Spirochaetales bacterium]
SRYVDGIMIRTDLHSKVVELAKTATVPVINGLSDLYHPCQALADFFTIYEREKKLEKVKLAYVGDGNNMVHSLLIGAAMLGMDIAVACPKSYQPDSHVSARAFQISSQTGSKITVTTDINLAVEGAHYLYTDVWTSMGMEKEASRRRRAFADYKITRKVLRKCADRCAVMHCLPAHRGEEIDDDVIDSDCSIVFDQAENRLHVQKALLCALMN